MDVISGVVSNPSLRSVLECRPIPIDPATDSIRTTGGILSSNVYFTADASGWEHESILVASTSITAVYTSLNPAAAAPRYLQLHIGIALPAAGAFPLLQSATLVPLGGVWQWLPPEGVTNPSGYIVVASTTQYTYTDVGALLKEIRTTALGAP